jgi:hypothetical protein
MTRNALAHREQSMARGLRQQGVSRRPVVLSLTERCEPRRIEGRVTYVAVTGAYAIIDGWHVPVVDILGVVSPHFSQKAAA